MNEKVKVKGDKCAFPKGEVVDQWLTGDDECNAYSYKFECGGVYHNNFMDVVGCRDHDCFWNCSECKYAENNIINIR